MSILLRALRGEPVERTPIWFMRQAGRYLPEYREVRSRVAFADLCGDADLACEVTIQPVDRFKLDAAIVFSDIMPVVASLGCEVHYKPGPFLPEPIRTQEQILGLVRPDVADALPVVPETIRRFRKLRPDTPIIGFAGAPWTLLCYMVEGGGSKNWIHPKKLIMEQPRLARRALELLADVVGDYLQLQVDAGAEAVQLFDTWAGVLSAEDYRVWALPAVQQALERVKGAPRIYFTKDVAPFLPMLPKTGADALGIDWRTDIRSARHVLGDIPIQGNLDPVALFGPTSDIRRRVRTILNAAGPLGHVFNLGHGILPETPIEGVQAMVDAVREWRWENSET